MSIYGIIIGIALVVWMLSLIPSFYLNYTPAKITSVTSVVVMAVVGSTYLVMGLPFAGIAAYVTGFVWWFLFLRRTID